MGTSTPARSRSSVIIPPTFQLANSRLIRLRRERSLDMIEVQDLTKTYRLGSVEVPALCGISFRIERGEVVAIMGQSGSGKSTLMNILGCLDQPTSGRYQLDGMDVGTAKPDVLAEIRNRQIGFVFQNFNL